jgi:PIN domain nuclease of toxin-antitoxin system
VGEQGARADRKVGLTFRIEREREVEREGFSKLAITLGHGQHAGSLPEIHRDPFDRMLVAQAQLENLELISADPIFAKYSVRLIRAND